MSQIYRAVIIRLFPDKTQNKKLWENAGAARWIWNWGLAMNRELYAKERRIFSSYGLRQKFADVRGNDSYKWLRKISELASVTTLRDLDRAYKNYYIRIKAGLKGGHPKFKAKGKCTPSFYVRSERVYIDDQSYVYLEKIGHVRCKTKGNLQDVRFYNARVKFEAGKWLLKCAVKTEAIHHKGTLRNVKMGIDLGVKVLAVLSCGGKKRVFKNINRSHRMRRLIRQLKHHQRLLGRKQKQSRNRLKERYRVQKIYGRIKRIRHDYIQQTTRKIADMKPSAVILEDLNISGMMKNRHLARAVSEQNLYLFRMLMERKAEEAGIKVVYADRFYPSSKKCSYCGCIKEHLSLSERVYKCPVCGLDTDRDFNAAKNLEELAY